MFKLISAIIIVSISFFSCTTPISLEAPDSQTTQPIASDSRAPLTNPANVVLESARISWMRDLDSSRKARMTGYARIKNLTYQKSVILHVGVSQTFAAPETWVDIPAVYVQTFGNGAEQWKFETPWEYTGSGQIYTFCLKYTAGGVTYWDNNSGANYKLSAGFDEGRGFFDGFHGALNNGAIALDSPDGWYNDTHGVDAKIRIWVKNLAYKKSVKVVYTFDNWATNAVVAAGYQSSQANNTEFWSAPLTIPAGIKTMKYALVYEVNGQTYWDNNAGQNYTWPLGLGDY